MTAGRFRPKLYLILLSIFAVVIAVALLMVNINKYMKTDKPVIFPEGYEIGVWEWRNVEEINETDTSKEFAELKDQGINTIYLEISTVGYINQLPDDEKQVEISKLELSLETYIKDAQEHGIKVQALAGENTWGNADSRHFPLEILEFVFEYNSKVPENQRFTGIQFNIEQYNQEGFNKSKDRYMAEYFETVENLVTQYKALYTSLDQVSDKNIDFSLGFTAPFWMDGSNSSFKEITLNGKKKFPVFHMIDILGQAPNTYIAIMNYRNYTHGEDGSIENIRDELNYLKKNKSSVQITVGQETTYVEPLKITFFGFSKESLKQATLQIAEEYKDHPNLKGFSIHTLQTFLRLK